MVSESLRRGYGLKFIYKGFDDAKHSIPFMRKVDSFSPDTIFVRDSDTHLIYETQLDSDNTFIRKSKAAYDWFGVTGNVYDQDLINGWGVPNFIVGDSDLLTDGRVLRDSDDSEIGVIFFKDSENAEWFTVKRRKETNGGSLPHYIKRRYVYPSPRITNVESGLFLNNQQNTDFNMFDTSGSGIIIEGTDLVSTIDSRKITHLDYTNNTAILWVHDGSRNKDIQIVYNNTTYDSEITRFDSEDRCYGEVYTGVITGGDSDLLFSTTQAIDSPGTLFVRMITEFTDSEVAFQAGVTDSELPFFHPVFYSDSDQDSDTNFVTNFVSPEEPAWRVFGDSDNIGFKAAPGVESGFIGYRIQEETINKYVLKNVLIQNTPATEPAQRPYDFDIEG